LLAHLAGFASINAWGAIQQLPAFQSPLMSFAVLPLAACGQFALQRATDYLRETVAAGDGEKDEKEKSWDRACEDAENDVMGLTLSFNLVQALRFTITSALPGQDGKEPQEILHDHTLAQAAQLLGCGMCCIPVMVIMFLRMKKKEIEGEDDEDELSESESEEEEEEQEEHHEETKLEYSKGDRVQGKRKDANEKEYWHHAGVKLVYEDGSGSYVLDWDDGESKDLIRKSKDMRKEALPKVDHKVEVLKEGSWILATVTSVQPGLLKVKHSDQKAERKALSDIREEVQSQNKEKPEEEEDESLFERLMGALTITFAMAFAWSTFFAAQMGLATFPVLTDPMVLAVALTLFISFVSFSAIRLLDLIDDFCKDTSSLCVAKSVVGRGYLMVHPTQQRVMQSPAGENGKARRSEFVAEERTDKGKTCMMLKHGSTWVLKNGKLSADKKDKAKACLDKVKKPDSTGKVRIAINDREYDLYPKGGDSTKKVDLCLKKVIRALGILVGFGWEQCFDEAVESLSKVMPAPHIAKFGLALFCIVIIVPAWKWYVLPMSEQAGWKFGFVVDHQDDKWSDIVCHLTTKKGLRPQADHVIPHLAKAYITDRAIGVMDTASLSQSLLKTSCTTLFGDGEPTASTPLLTDHHGHHDGRPEVQEGRLPRFYDGSPVRSPRGAGAVSAEIQTLRDTNVQLRVAADGFLDLYVKLRETSGEDRRCLLRSYNQQMDQMLGRMRDLQATVSRNRSASPSPVASRRV